MLLDYNVYMAKYVNPQAPQRSPTATDSPSQSPEGSPKTTKKVGKERDAGKANLEIASCSGNCTFEAQYQLNQFLRFHLKVPFIIYIRSFGHY